MADKYDEAVAYLIAHPEDIEEAWNRPLEHRAGCLFVHCTPDGLFDRTSIGNCNSGCLTQVRAGDGVAWTPALTTAIRRDKTVPKYQQDITVADLPRFAYWQRRLDKAIRGKA